MAESPGAKHTSNQPSMAELLEESLPLKELRRGEVIEGQVMRVDQDGILVSVGHKSEGIVPQREMRTIGDPVSRYKVGQTIDVFIIDPAGGEGQAILSIDRARGESAWGVLEQLAESGGTIDAKIVGHNRGGLVVDIDGLQAFVPLSQAVLPAGGDQDEALTRRQGEEITVKVLEVNRRRNRAVVSERSASREQREGLKDQLLDSLQEGNVRHGKVTGVSNFGAFVDIGGADGLIHISELSWTPVTSVEEVVQAGQELDVYVLRVDRENRRIALSLRRLQPTPWDEAANKFEVGQLVTGSITKLADFGAFARVEDVVEGLIHVSELTERHIRHPKEVVQVGDTMTLRIVSMDLERHRLGLSLKQVEDYTPENREAGGEAEP
ncbi:MAG: S1 RNA-binding domain-containing protein [Dehalococcoidia bacterium]